MGFQVERFSPLKVANHGAQLHQLVSREREWVGSALPKVVERYGDTSLKARANYFRLAASKAVHAYVILDTLGDIAGTASAMPHQRLLAQDGSFSRKGTDVDYWTKEGLGVEVHDEIGKLLVKKVREDAPSLVYHTDYGGGNGATMEEMRSRSHCVMTTAIPNIPNQPWGLISQLEAVAGPQVYATDAAPELELTKGGQPLQLYYGEFPYDPKS